MGQQRLSVRVPGAAGRLSRAGTQRHARETAQSIPRAFNPDLQPGPAVEALTFVVRGTPSHDPAIRQRHQQAALAARKHVIHDLRRLAMPRATSDNGLLIATGRHTSRSQCSAAAWLHLYTVGCTCTLPFCIHKVSRAPAECLPGTAFKGRNRAAKSTPKRTKRHNGDD